MAGFRACLLLALATSAFAWLHPRGLRLLVSATVASDMVASGTAALATAALATVALANGGLGYGGFGHGGIGYAGLGYGSNLGYRGRRRLRLRSHCRSWPRLWILWADRLLRRCASRKLRCRCSSCEPHCFHLPRCPSRRPPTRVASVATYAAAPAVAKVATTYAAPAVTSYQTYHAAPAVAKVATTYAAPAVTYHAAPAVAKVATTYHAAPAVASYAVAPVATYAAAPAVAKVATTYAAPVGYGYGHAAGLGYGGLGYGGLGYAGLGYGSGLGYRGRLGYGYGHTVGLGHGFGYSGLTGYSLRCPSRKLRCRCSTLLAVTVSTYPRLPQPSAFLRCCSSCGQGCYHLCRPSRDQLPDLPRCPSCG
uniref:Putative salivary secreted protein of 21.3 kDa n=1 Tax=Ixodes ricinus TaxID=34613 RepID=V5GZS6_IXORI